MIESFLDKAKVSGPNRRNLKIHDAIAPLYDFPYDLYDFLSRGGIKRERLSYLQELEIKPDSAVLEVAVGTGANLRYLPETASYFGLDISLGMLKKCQKNLMRWGREAQLFQGEAENLPFDNSIFDVVFHMGGIDSFSDRAKAIKEMVRVAKPGAKLLIAGETEMPFKVNSAPKITPAALLPSGMENIEYEETRGLRLYCLTFRKPSN